MIEKSDKTEDISFAVFGTIMSLLTIGAIISNIICFRMTSKLLKNKPSLVLVLNLNISDVLVALISWAAFMTQHISNQLDRNLNIVVYKVFWSILVTLGNVTILTLSGLALDCFVALRWPLHYKDMLTSRAMRIFITVTWTTSLLAGSGDFLLALSKYHQKDSYRDAIHDTMVLTSAENSVSEKITASLTLLLSNILSFLCLVSLVIIYSYILTKIRRIKKNSSLTKRGGFKSEIHAVRTTLMVFVSFLLLWIPTLTMNVITVIRPDFLSKLTYMEASFIGYTADSLLMVHSMVDALIYGKRVKKTIKRQRHSLLTIQDFIKNTNRASNSSSSISLSSLSPVRQKSGVYVLSKNASLGTITTTLGNGYDSRLQLHPIAELCESNVSDYFSSENATGPTTETLEAGEDEEEGDDSDSQDEGIGTHSESGSEENNHTSSSTREESCRSCSQPSTVTSLTCPVTVTVVKHSAQGRKLIKRSKSTGCITITPVQLKGSIKPGGSFRHKPRILHSKAKISPGNLNYLSKLEEEMESDKSRDRIMILDALTLSKIFSQPSVSSTVDNKDEVLPVSGSDSPSVTAAAATSAANVQCICTCNTNSNISECTRL